MTTSKMALFYLLIHLMLTASEYCDDEWSDLTNYDVDADRVYYIGCVEEEWDYCPSGMNLITGENITEGTDAAVWCLGNGIDLIGAKYIKGLYREFKSNCFVRENTRKYRDKHLGALGPNIRALTGETIKVFYKNTCSFPNSMHPHGVKYDKTSEGAPYDDDALEGDIVVADGGQWIYVWKAREQLVDDSVSSKMWLYHSHVDEITDIHSGLFGALIITKDGYQRSDANLRPIDVDREFVTFMVLYDENASHLFEDNMYEYLGLSFNSRGTNMLVDDEDFIESNLMHAINGYLFGNARHLICKEGEEVRWYTASFGNEGDGPHSPHWHGNIAIDNHGENTDTLLLIPGTTKDVTMTVDAPGEWLYHCHIHDHIEAGMITTYFAKETIKESDDSEHVVVINYSSSD